MSVYLVLYIVGNSVYVHVRDACRISHIHRHVLVEFHIVPFDDMEASDTLG